MANTTITNSDVNSGTAINMQAYDLNTTIEIFTSVNDVPGKTGATFASRLPQGHNSGFAAPVHTVQGVYRIQDGHTTGASATMDYTFVKELCINAGNVMSLVDDKLGTVNVLLLAYDDKRGAGDSQDGDWIMYTMTFIEVAS